MKKLILGVAIAFAAVMANAATYDWQMSFLVSPDGENPLVGTVYAFDSNAYAYSVISEALTTTGTSALDSALGHNAIDGDGVALVSGSDLTDNGAAVAPTASMYAIIIGEANDTAYFYSVGFDSVAITDAIVAGGATFALDYVETGAIGGAGWTAVAVPEPTSGLLLVVGGALLALRRRRLA